MNSARTPSTLFHEALILSSPLRLFLPIGLSFRWPNQTPYVFLPLLPPRTTFPTHLASLTDHTKNIRWQILIKKLLIMHGLGQLSRYSDSLRAGRTEIEPRKGRYFPHPSRPTLGPPNLLYNGYGSVPGVKRPGRGVDHPPQLEPRLKKVYYPLGSRGLS
jgi:hypothetical protein